MTVGQFDAYAALERLRARYISFLLDTFGIRSDELARQLRSHWTAAEDCYPLLAPTLVQPAFPFRPDRNISRLRATGPAPTSEGPLHPSTVAALAKRLDFDLFVHQVQTIQAASLGKTTVLSAGTGSGKTEAFLISIMDALHWAEARGLDNLDEPGVRAIVVYPLNALVNNQIARMQQLFADQSRVRFGFYTSRLPESYKRAQSWYERRGQPLPPPCQIIDRKTLRGLDTKASDRPVGPPHILVTNFSMLEYMLIRPLDRSIFLPGNTHYKEHPKLRVIVLDEAHVYAGAQASEIHMLLRRTALRFGTTLEHVQGIATSATLAQGSQEAQAVQLAEYGARMFGKARSAVHAVVAEPYLPELSEPVVSRAPLRLLNTASAEIVPASVRTLDFDADGRVQALVRDRAGADQLARSAIALGIATEDQLEAVAADDRDTPARVIYQLLAQSGPVRELRERIAGSRLSALSSVDDIAESLFGGRTEPARRATDAVLRLGALARSSPTEHPLLPTRMHALLRAPAGVWTDVTVPGSHAWPWGPLTTSPPLDDSHAQRMFEVVICMTCGRDYVLAFESDSEWGERCYRGFATAEAASCVKAFAVQADGLETLPWRRLQGVCVSLERQGGSVRRLFKGTCAQCGDPKAQFGPIAMNPRGAIGAVVDSIFPYLAEQAAEPTGRKANAPHRLGGGRRLLSFSDSRQEAARVAHDVEYSHDAGLTRALVYGALGRCGSEAVTVTDLIDELSRDPGLLERAPAAEVRSEVRNTPDFREELATLSIIEELATPLVAARLEGLGLIEVVYPQLPASPPGLGMDPEAWRGFLPTVLDLLRGRGAVVRPPGMRVELRDRLPRWLNKAVVLQAALQDEDDDSDSVSRAERVQLIADRAAQPSRLRTYCHAVAAECRIDGGGDRLLHAVWDTLQQLSTIVPWVKADSASGGYLFNLLKLKARRHERPQFVEPVSGRFFPRSAAGVAPVGLRPREPLRSPSEAELRAWQSRHAVQRVLQDEKLGLASAEHTAQIDVDALDAEEQRFREGAVNLLACSTTMEMGVDLGGLTLVMMMNVPPSAANYWQRAGRAGRRADGSSLALTLALARPHDQRVFDAAREFLGEPMIPPRVRFDLPALLLRHVTAQLLTAFFTEAVRATNAGNPMKAFGTVGEFCVNAPNSSDVTHATMALVPDARCIADLFLAWLDTISDAHPVSEQIRRLVHGTVLVGRSTAELATHCRNAVAKAYAQVRNDIASIEAQRESEAQQGAGGADNQLLRALRHQERAIKQELLIAFFAKHDVLPRFGFPLDVVRLETTWKLPDKDAEDDDSDHEEVLELRMERDLKVALAEYVPGTRVLAAKRLRASRGLIPNWRAETTAQARSSYFVHCAECGYLEVRQTRSEAPCVMCKHPVGVELYDLARDPETDAGPTPLRQYLVPSSFSVALNEQPERPVGLARPERMPPPFSYVSSAGNDAVFVDVCEGIQVGFESSTTIAFRSEGRLAPSRKRGFGYAICQRCGRAVPESKWGGQLPGDLRAPHSGLRGGACSGQAWRNIALGTWTRGDTLRVRLSRGFSVDLARRRDEEDFYLSLAGCLQELIAEELQVDRRTLLTAVGVWRDAGGEMQREAIVWDPGTSGMLEHVLASAGDLMRRLVERLETQASQLSYVRFDNQFMMAEGRFRLDLLREHFLHETRYQLATLPSTQDGPKGARPDPVRSLAVRALDSGSAPFLLLAPRLAADAFTRQTDSFGRDGLLRVAMALELRTPGSIRLLLGELPSPDDGESVAVANALADLIEAGAAVRVEDDASIFATPSRLVYTRDGMRRALGALQQEGGGWQPSQVCFGSDWGVGYVTVELRGREAEPEYEHYTRAWEAARPVDAKSLRPKPSSGLHYVEVAHGATDAIYTSLPAMLAHVVGSDLGTVKSLFYRDRYLTNSAIAAWNMFRTLHAFEYAKRAAVRVECFTPSGFGNRSVKEVLAAHPRDPLSEAEMKTFAKALQAESHVKTTFDFVPEGGHVRIPHGRVMEIEFEAGSRLNSLRINPDMGMDWIYSSNSQRWSEGTLMAKATHFVFLENYRAPRPTAGTRQQSGRLRT